MACKGRKQDCLVLVDILVGRWS